MNREEQLNSRITSGILTFVLSGLPSAVLNRSLRFSRVNDALLTEDISLFIIHY